MDAVGKDCSIYISVIQEATYFMLDEFFQGWWSYVHKLIYNTTRLFSEEERATGKEMNEKE